ncbi:uncharacterized protein [Primulina huaijiensis]|uniref:uncharacterized protein n=1 Tax=Primulina huaijiensis TaxID=1492673 RepID=UPI003CC78183
MPVEVEFLKLVRDGEHHSALKIASSHLGPLTAKALSLLKPLKEVLLTFLTLNEEATLGNLRLDALATSLQVAVGRRLGIEEPKLMKIVRTTLHSHSEWFKLPNVQRPVCGTFMDQFPKRTRQSSAWRWYLHPRIFTSYVILGSTRTILLGLILLGLTKMVTVLIKSRPLILDVTKMLY